MNKSIEELVINAFILKRRRERVWFELTNSKKREKFLWRMQNTGIFDSSCMERISQPIESPQIVYDILKKRGAPDACYVMCIYSPYDGQIVTLEQGLTDVVFKGPGLISCIHGELAYLEDEGTCGPGPPERFLLVKK